VAVAGLAITVAAISPFAFLTPSVLIQTLVYEARSEGLTMRGEPGLGNLLAYILHSYWPNGALIGRTSYRLANSGLLPVGFPRLTTVSELGV